MLFTSVQAAISKTSSDAPFHGAAVDVTAIAGDFDLVLRVNRSSVDKKAKLIFEYSTDSFVTSKPLSVTEVGGGITPTSPWSTSLRQRDFPSVPLSQIGAELRLTLASMDSGATINYEAWIES